MNGPQAALPGGSGVQELIDRLRQDGKQAGEAEAAALLEEAKHEAARIIETATTAAERSEHQAAEAIAAREQAALNALKMAARDTILELKGTIAHSFERYLRHLVGDITADPGFIKTLVLVLAGEAAEKHITDQQALIRIRRNLLTEEHLGEAGSQLVGALASDMLRAGITLVGDDTVPGGARVQLVKGDLEIDLSDGAITALLARHLLPRFTDLLEGDEESDAEDAD